MRGDIEDIMIFDNLLGAKSQNGFQMTFNNTWGFNKYERRRSDASIQLNPRMFFIQYCFTRWKAYTPARLQIPRTHLTTIRPMVGYETTIVYPEFLPCLR